MQIASPPFETDLSWMKQAALVETQITHRVPDTTVHGCPPSSWHERL